METKLRFDRSLSDGPARVAVALCGAGRIMNAEYYTESLEPT
jgi:hypothetical protein